MKPSSEAIQLLCDAAKFIRAGHADQCYWDRTGEAKHINHNLAEQLFAAGLARKSYIPNTLIPTDEGYRLIDSSGAKG